MEAAVPQLTVQSIREKFETQAAIARNQRLPADTSTTSTPTGCPFSPQTRVSIKRSPAFRNYADRASAKPAEEEEVPVETSKKPSLKRKPGVDRTSKPAALTGLKNSPVNDASGIDEALKAPLPAGPAPKKPPRTFLHDIYMESKGLVSKVEAPQRPARKKSAKVKDDITISETPVKKTATLMRSKTDPSIKRRSGDTPGRSSRTRNDVQEAEVILDRRKESAASWDETLTQCRWSNPVQWNSFSPPRKSHSASAFKGSTATLKNRFSTSLLALVPEQRKTLNRGTLLKNHVGVKKDKNRNFTETLASFETPSSTRAKREDFEVSAGKEFDFSSEPTTVYDEPCDESGLHYMSSPVIHLDSTDGKDLQDRLNDDSDSEADNNPKDLQVVEDRKIYIRRVSSNVCDLRKRSALTVDEDQSLFDAFLVVALYYDRQSHCYNPYIKSRCPSYVNVPEGVEQFCFPDSSDWSSAKCTAEPFTIVLTDHEGRRQFGYCRRIVPEGSQAPLPITYCILSKHKSSGFYSKVLLELTSRHGIAESHRVKLLDTLKHLRFPGPGQSVVFADPLSGKDVKLTRSLDARLEDCDLRVLFSKLDHSTISSILGTLLLERKLLFFGTDLSLMSSCVLAVQQMLYPFTWQHTLVPVLPKSMSELCTAPTPYIMGVLSDDVAEIYSFNPDEGMVVNLDNGQIVHRVGDESSLLPKRAQRSLQSSWEMAEALTEEDDAVRNALLSESFVRFFVEVCGHYGQFIKSQGNGQKIFEKTGFVESHSSHSVRLFLDWFTETAMFNLFIESRLKEGSFQGLFEHKIMEKSIQLESSPQLILRNSKLFSRKIKSIGDKLREMSVF